MSNLIQCVRCNGMGTLPRQPQDNITMVCDICNGWKVMMTNSCTDKHEWKHKERIGRYCDRYKCDKCGVERTIDSGD